MVAGGASVAYHRRRALRKESADLAVASGKYFDRSFRAFSLYAKRSSREKEIAVINVVRASVAKSVRF